MLELGLLVLFLVLNSIGWLIVLVMLVGLMVSISIVRISSVVMNVLLLMMRFSVNGVSLL